MSLARSRSLFFLAAMTGFAVLSVSLYVEQAFELSPCSLCLMQRCFLLAFCGVCLAVTVHGPGRAGLRVYSSLGLFFALGGAISAGRQVLLQGEPQEQLMVCTPSLGYMVENLSVYQVVKLMFQGSAECAEVRWTFFAMSIPEWSLLVFSAVIVFVISQLLRPVPAR